MDFLDFGSNSTFIAELSSITTSSPLRNVENCTCPPYQRLINPGVAHPDLNFIIGLVLAISSSVFIGTSFILKKKSLISLARRGESLRAANGGLGYLKDGLWWAGLIVMALGEVANFAAYAFAPASLVTPLGGLSVVFTAILSTFMLKERLNLIGKLGCGICLLGSIITILHAPKNTGVDSLTELTVLLGSPAFVAYLFIVVIATLILMFYFAPRYGNSNIFVYILVCSLVGSLTVMSVKGVALAIKGTIEPNGVNEFANGYTYIFIVTLILCVTIQMNYLNRALDVFNTAVVSPIYYVLFTSFVMIATGVLYDEFTHLSWIDDVGLLCGFLVIVLAVFLLHLFKDYEIGLRDVSYVFGPQRKPMIIVATKKSASNGSKSNSHVSSFPGLGRDNPDFAVENLPLLMASHSLGSLEKGSLSGTRTSSEKSSSTTSETLIRGSVSSKEEANADQIDGNREYEHQKSDCEDEEIVIKKSKSISNRSSSYSSDESSDDVWLTTDAEVHEADNEIEAQDPKRWKSYGSLDNQSQPNLLQKSELSKISL